MSTLEGYKRTALKKSCSKCWFNSMCNRHPANKMQMYMRISDVDVETVLSAIAKDCNKYIYSVGFEYHRNEVLQTEDSFIFGVENE